MTDFYSNVAALISACNRELDDDGPGPAPEGYPESLALCIIDAVYSVGARYSLVLNVLDRYREMRIQAGADADADSADDLVATVVQAGGPDRWAARLRGGRADATTFTVPLKAASTIAAAHALPDHGVVTTADLRSVATSSDTLYAVQRAWRGAVGPGCAHTWHHLLRLAHAPTVHPDRVVVSYVANAIGIRPSLLSPHDAHRLIDEVAKALDWDAATLNHAIWRYQSGRPSRIVNLPAL